LHKEACQRLIQSKDWQLVSELLNQHLANITDIRFLSLTEKALDKNIVWAGRNAGYLALKSFLDDVGLYGDKTSKKKENWE